MKRHQYALNHCAYRYVVCYTDFVQNTVPLLQEKENYYKHCFTYWSLYSAFVFCFGIWCCNLDRNDSKTFCFYLNYMKHWSLKGNTTQMKNSIMLSPSPRKVQPIFVNMSCSLSKTETREASLKLVTS